MAKYLLSVQYDQGATMPSPEDLARIEQKADDFHAEVKAAGAWVFGGGLHPADTATVVRAQGGEVLTTDGPFTETKEQLGGLSVVEAADLDGALAWAAKASAATECPIEVRPFQGTSAD